MNSYGIGFGKQKDDVSRDSIKIRMLIVILNTKRYNLNTLKRMTNRNMPLRWSFYFDSTHFY